MQAAPLPRSPRVAGRTFRFQWQSGPTAGKTHEHAFHADGSVSFGLVENGNPVKPTTEKQYAAFDVAQDVVLVSYLGSSGYTLTVTMNFGDRRLRGVASGEGQWFPVEGTFTSVQ